jgi:hypothetical protein
MERRSRSANRASGPIPDVPLPADGGRAVGGGPKYRRDRSLETAPRANSHSIAMSIVALTWSTPHRDRYGLATDALKTSAFSCQYMALVSPSMSANSNARSDGTSRGRDGSRDFLDAAVASESIVLMAAAAATPYFPPPPPSFLVPPALVAGDNAAGGGCGAEEEEGEDPPLIEARRALPSVAVPEDDAILVASAAFLAVLFGASGDDDDDGGSGAQRQQLRGC